MTAPKKMTVREARGRVKHRDALMLAAITLRGYGFPELADEIESLSRRVADGELDFDIERIA